MSRRPRVSRLDAGLPASEAIVPKLTHAIGAGQTPAQLFGYIGVEPYPGVSPLSRLEAKPSASNCGDGAADGSFEFTGLPESTYHLRVQLPDDLFIWWASTHLNREYPVRTGKMCEADFPLYRKGDPYAANQPR